MIYPGQDLKYRITSKLDDFNLSRDNFEIVMKDRYGAIRCTIKKEDCFYDTEGHWYFALESVEVGPYFAFFKAFIDDDDYDKQKAVFIDEQFLFMVSHNCCGSKEKKSKCKCDHKILYERVWSVSIDGADYLADCYGNYVYTSDGKRIQFTNQLSETVDDMGKVKMKMTGDEFLQFMEGRNPNGEIDTIPEMIDAAKGIGDDETIKEEIGKEVEEADVERVTPEELDNFEV